MFYKRPDIYGLFKLRDIQNRVENWDMSYKGIKDMVKFIKKGNGFYD